VAVIVGVAAPANAGVNVIAVPELTPVVALRVPADAGLTERFTVFVNAPVPVTVGMQLVVSTSEMDDGVHWKVTPVIVGACTVGGLIVIVAVPVTLVYPETVDAAIIVAVVVAVIVEEEVNTPPVVIVPADAGLTDHVTAWLGLSCPATVAAKEMLSPAVMVFDAGVTVTEVTVIVVIPPPVLPERAPPQPAMARMMKAMPRQNSLDANTRMDAATALLRMALSPLFG
jgi:hypothetical protein